MLDSLLELDGDFDLETVQNPVSVEHRPIRDDDETVGGEAILNDDSFEVEAVGDEAVADDI